jgi:uncharacterized protein
MTILRTTPGFFGMILALALLLASGPARAVTDERQAQRVIRVLDQHTIPGFAALKDAAAKLPEAVSQVCKAASQDASAALRDAFRETGKALAAVDFYRFGPLADQGRRERLSFWPDPRGAVSRQLREVLAAKDATVLTLEGLSRQSAAIQGLPALELLLTNKEQPLSSDEEAKFACGLASAIAQNIASISRDVYEAWTSPQGMRAKLLAAGPANATYKTPSEAAADLLRSLLTGLQAVSELQLKPRLAGAKPAAKGPFAKLGLERDAYQAAIASLQRLYAALDLEADLAPEKNWMKGWAAGAWRAMSISDGMGAGAKGIAAADAPKLNEVVSRVGGLRMLIGKEMSKSAGIVIGFNELDGD